MDATKEYIIDIKNKFPLEEIKRLLDSFKDKKVLVIGDTIIDEYCFVETKGKAVKVPILTAHFVREEIYAGGVMAIANHLSTFVKEVKIVSLLGDINPQIEFIQDSLYKNVEMKSFVKENSRTIIKKRLIENYRKNKLFRLDFVDGTPLSDKITQEISDYLDEELPKYDLVMVGDFGHESINDKIIGKLEEKSKYLAVNVQINSSNRGFNFFTKYKKADFRSMDEEELRVPLLRKLEPVKEVIKEAYEKHNLNKFILTLGKKGCVFYKDGDFYQSPILIKSVIDTIGAGDALFSITALLNYAQVNEELIPFLGNCAGGIAANIMGNKESVTKESLFKFVEERYKEVDEINQYFDNIGKSLNNLDKGKISSVVKQLLETYHKGGIIYAFGNGGSGATASHFCGDLIKGVSYGLDKRFKAVCLNDNIPALMAIANDISYDDIFIEQLKNFLNNEENKENLVVGISGSGNSLNVVKALEYAKEVGANTLAICGFKGGKIKEIADLTIHAGVDDMEISEDIHNLIITHCVKRALTKELNNTNLGKEYEKRVA